MGTFSLWHWVIVLVVVLLLFGGGGKIPRIMGDLAKGIRSFKSGLKEEEGDEKKEAEPSKSEPPRVIEGKADPVVSNSQTVREDETVKG